MPVGFQCRPYPLQFFHRTPNAMLDDENKNGQQQNAKEQKNCAQE